MRWRVLSVIATLYAVQFIPAIFIFMTLPIIMREAGQTATTIGLLQLVGIPYIVKFLWAPLIDKYALGKHRYKSWIVLLSTIHIGALISLAFLDPAGPIAPLFLLLVIAVAAVSTQDVAVDALAISLMKPTERTLGASFQNFGMYLSAVIGAFGFLQLYSLIGWTAALLAQALLFTIPLFCLLLVKEPERPSNAPAINIRSVFSFFTQPNILSWLGLLATIRLPLIFISLPIRLMMVDQGMSTEEIALWFGLIAMSCAGTAALTIGPLLSKLPKGAILFLVGGSNLAVLLLICFLANALPDAIRFAIVLTWVAIAVTDIMLMRGAMDRVRPQSPGFDFSIQVALFTLLAMLSSPITGAIIDLFGYLPIFFIAVLLATIPLVILKFFFKPSSQTDCSSPVISTSTFATSHSQAILASCEYHFKEHGIECRHPQPDSILMKAMGCTVEMQALTNRMDVRIETPTDNYMVFIRDELVEHISAIDSEAAERMQWTGGLGVGELPSNFRILRATQRREVFPGLIRVTLTGSDVNALNTEGIHIKLMMPKQRGRTPTWPVINENGGIRWPQGEDKLHTRFVTIRHIRLDQNEIDVDIAHHQGGLISDWARLDNDHQEVGIMGPGGDTELPSTNNILLAADLTGLPALARLIESQQGHVNGHLFAAAPSQQALEDYLPASNLTVTAISPADFSTEVIEQLTLLASQDQLQNQQNSIPANISYAWFAGESTTNRQVRSLFKEQLKLTKDNYHCSAYWKKGEPGHNA